MRALASISKVFANLAAYPSFATVHRKVDDLRCGRKLITLFGQEQELSAACFVGRAPCLLAKLRGSYSVEGRNGRHGSSALAENVFSP